MSIYLFTMIIFLVGVWILETASTLLNLKALTPTVPQEFADVIDEGGYRKALRYAFANARFSLASDTFSTLLVLVCLLFGVFDFADSVAEQLVSGPIMQGLVFFALLGLGSSVVSLPFSYYRTFVLEEQFGFNRTTMGTFVLDRIKGTVLSVLIGGPLAAGVLWFFMAFGSYAWIMAWAFFVCILLVVQYLAPVYIMPLFNKFSPLEAGELKERIEGYIASQGFSLSGLFVMDGSKRSGKGNAFFTGFGSKRRIALFDTLINSLSTDELVGVVAHEVGHCKRGHIKRMLIAGIIKTGLMFFLLSFLIGNERLFAELEMHRVTLHAGIVFFMFLYTPVSLVYGIWANARSRFFEYEADTFAAETTGKPLALASALKRLSRDNLSNLTPHPLVVILHYSHPPVLERVEALKALAGEEVTSPTP